jgi:hypothetical protein
MLKSVSPTFSSECGTSVPNQSAWGGFAGVGVWIESTITPFWSPSYIEELQLRTYLEKAGSGYEADG